MITCRFVGNTSTIEGYPRLEVLGQRIDIPEDILRVHGGDGNPSGRPPLISEQQWVEIGFTEEELDHFKMPGTWRYDMMTPAFEGKLRIAWGAVQDFYSWIDNAKGAN